MRFLFSFIGGTGHFEPLVPIARAAEAAGHTVAVSGSPGMVASVEAAGFTAFQAGLGSAVQGRQPLLPLDVEREHRDLRERFIRRGATARVPDMLRLIEEWRPDLVVCDEGDVSAMIAAERLGVVHATVLSAAAGSFGGAAVIAGPLDELRAAHGLPPDPELRVTGRHLVLSPFPPSFRDPAFPLPATAHTIRIIDPRPHRGGSIYFSLGTVFNTESGDLFTRVLAGLRELDRPVVVTVGRQIDPAELGPQPPHVRVERFVPQAEVLPECDLVVSHGGSGSVLGALAHGLPMVLIPRGADPPNNARRCEELGVGRWLDPIAATPEDVREAAASVRADPSYRRAAEGLRDELAAQPGPEYAVELLTRL